jgi:hypothetical protein
VYPLLGLPLAAMLFFCDCWIQKAWGFFLNGRKCLVESGFDKAGKALVRLAAAFCLQTQTGTGQAGLI